MCRPDKARAGPFLPKEGTTAMADFNTYKDMFPHAKLSRSPEGVLEVVLHTNGDTLIFNGYTHEEFVDLFHQISQDARNRVVILTGSGGAFMESISPEGFDFFSPQGYDKIYREGKKVLMNILDIDVGEQDIFGVQPHRAVHRSDHRYLDV